MEFPSDVKYFKTHEWLRIDGNKAKLGITYYAQYELGDIVYVELPEVGDKFAKDDEIGMIDSAKTSAAIYAPLDCKVVAVNEELNDKPELVNESPYDEGYFMEIEFTKPIETDLLLDAEGYKAFVDSGGEE